MKLDALKIKVKVKFSIWSIFKIWLANKLLNGNK